MKKLLLIIVCLSLQSNAATLVQKGYYEVWCDGVKISQHTTYHKSLETAVNMGKSCSVKQPEVEIQQVGTTENDFSVKVSWVAPSKRENGTKLLPTEISHYTIFTTRSDKLVSDAIQILANGQTNFQRTFQLAPGVWSFAATATDKSGLESKLSFSVTKSLPKVAP